MDKVKCNFFILLLVVFNNCYGQQDKTGELFITGFKWKLNIPQFLIPENPEEWKIVQERGKKAFEDTYNTSLNNKLKTIFIFKAKDTSFFEAVNEPISDGEAKNYLAVCEKMNTLVYNTLKTQAPTAQIDTTKREEIIDSIPFQVLEITMIFPDGNKRMTTSYRSVFGNKELTISAMYSNKESGDKIINAIRNSRFNEN